MKALLPRKVIFPHLKFGSMVKFVVLDSAFSSIFWRYGNLGLPPRPVRSLSSLIPIIPVDTIR